MISNEVEVDEDNETKAKSFHELELDDRILKVFFLNKFSLSFKRGYVSK